jgi:hypothetical protein
MKLANSQYPQIGTSVLQSPVKLTTGAATSAPNSSPYGISPVTSFMYGIPNNAPYTLPNVCALGGF